MIPYGRQSIDRSDVEAVVGVMATPWLTQGPEVEAFEDRLCAATGTTHAVAFANGTAALHAAAVAAGLGPSHRVATSPLSFVASANASRYVGADVTFADIDPDTLNLDLRELPDGLDALVAVHYAGLPLDLRAVGPRPAVVIEDAAHALGAQTPDGPVGNCAHSDMCCFSFHPVKTVTTGEGGAVTTNSEELAQRLRRFRHHGIVASDDRDEPWAYDVASLGMNYRITDIQCALGSSQLGRLDRFVSRRAELAERYRSALADSPVRLPPAAPEGFRHAWHLFPVRVRNRLQVYRELRAGGVGVQVHYVPTYRFSAYASEFRPSEFPHTEAAYAELLSLPMYPALSDDDQDRVIELLLRAVSR